MHSEWGRIDAETVDRLTRRRVAGGRIVAVGTTVVRTLEASAEHEGKPTAGFGATRLFVRPPYAFKVVDHLLTNFHLPRSTLLAMVMALAGVDLTRRAYREAIEMLVEAGIREAGAVVANAEKMAEPLHLFEVGDVQQAHGECLASK